MVYEANLLISNGHILTRKLLFDYPHRNRD